MQYREDILKLFRDWQSANPTATVLFKGYSDGFPSKIYVYNYVTNKSFDELQESYLQLIRNVYGENSVYGEDLSYAVELRSFATSSLKDVFFKLEGTL